MAAEPVDPCMVSVSECKERGKRRKEIKRCNTHPSFHPSLPSQHTCVHSRKQRLTADNDNGTFLFPSLFCRPHWAGALGPWQRLMSEGVFKNTKVIKYNKKKSWIC